MLNNSCICLISVIVAICVIGLIIWIVFGCLNKNKKYKKYRTFGGASEKYKNFVDAIRDELTTNNASELAENYASYIDKYALKNNIKVFKNKKDKIVINTSLNSSKLKFARWYYYLYLFQQINKIDYLTDMGIDKTQFINIDVDKIPIDIKKKLELLNEYNENSDIIPDEIKEVDFLYNDAKMNTINNYSKDLSLITREFINNNDLLLKISKLCYFEESYNLITKFNNLFILDSKKEVLTQYIGFNIILYSVLRNHGFKLNVITNESELVKLAKNIESIKPICDHLITNDLVTESIKNIPLSVHKQYKQEANEKEKKLNDQITKLDTLVKELQKNINESNNINIVLSSEKVTLQNKLKELIKDIGLINEERNRFRIKNRNLITEANSYQKTIDKLNKQLKIHGTTDASTISSLQDDINSLKKTLTDIVTALGLTIGSEKDDFIKDIDTLIKSTDKVDDLINIIKAKQEKINKLLGLLNYEVPTEWKSTTKIKIYKCDNSTELGYYDDATKYEDYRSEYENRFNGGRYRGGAKNLDVPEIRRLLNGIDIKDKGRCMNILNKIERIQKELKNGC